MFRSFVVLSLFIISGCSANNLVLEPDQTTYPRDRRVEEEVMAWVAPAIVRTTHFEVLPREDGSALASGESETSRAVTYDYTKVTVGDSATKEVWVRPGSGVGSSEDALLAALPARARSACGSEFRPLRTRYFLGHEATVQMSGIQGRSLRGEVRCNRRIISSDVPNEKQLRSFGSRTRDLGFFDASTIILPAGKEGVIAAVAQHVSDNRMVFISTAKNGNVSLFHAGFPRNSYQRRQDLIAVSPHPSGTRVTVIAPRYRDHIHSYSVFSNKPDKVLGVSPLERDRAYREAQLVFGSIARYLGTP